ncbi:MAG: rRNA pseudouridine synthase [Candidatus Cloacimonetes bacterium]|nr:rRNA pseudouridine synthase [Candidatus Cloacimonadota bacterium]
MLRINKFLARCNLGSRRKVEEFILNGQISVNDEICRDLSRLIDPKMDEVAYNGKKINLLDDKIYLMLNKPKNYLVSSRDDFGRKLVYDLLPDFKTHLFAIGRLDYNSEGLLLFTNDGEFANQIIHPRYKLPKTYKVTVKGKISDEQVEKLRQGVEIESGKTQTALVFVKLRGENKTILKVTIFEGQKRQIRYMLKAVGSEVLELKRLQIGNLKLGKLPSGMWRLLKPSEVTELLALRRLRKIIVKPEHFSGTKSGRK